MLRHGRSTSWFAARWLVPDEVLGVNLLVIPLARALDPRARQALEQ
jgi:hypothetical protein